MCSQVIKHHQTCNFPDFPMRKNVGERGGRATVPAWVERVAFTPTRSTWLVFFMVVPLLVELTWRLPDIYQLAGSGGDRHLNFHDCRDNLGEPAPARVRHYFGAR